MTEISAQTLPPLADQRVLVVGGCGFIGQHVVRHLLGAGAEVIVLDRAAMPAGFAGIDQAIGSVSDSTLMASAAAGCASVVYLAASSLPGTGNLGLSSEIRDHVEVTVKAAEIAAAQGVGQFVFCSSGGTVYGYASQGPLHEDMPTRPINAYGVSKLTIEHYLRLIARSQAMQTVSLRISNPYGEGQRAARNQGFIAAAMQHAMTGKPMPIWGDGSVERDFIHVDDVARAVLAACSVARPPAAINIGSGQATSLLQALARVEAALGRQVPVAFEPGRAVDVARNVLDIGRAAQVLGWRPLIGLDEGLMRTARWWQDQYFTAPAQG